MQKTRNSRAVRDYKFFKDAIKSSLAAKFDAGIASGVTEMVFDKTSCGIYAGVHAGDIQKEYEALVQEVLDEQVGPRGEFRWQYVNQAVIADL